MLMAGAFLFLPANGIAQIQKPNGAGDEETLRKGEIVAHNVQTALTEHQMEDTSFQASKQLPEDKRDFPKMLVLKDNTILLDWTSGQEARYLMEELRQDIHALQSVEKPRGFDIIALTGAREFWPKLRDISCRETPGIRYYDLDGFAQYCPSR